MGWETIIANNDYLVRYDVIPEDRKEIQRSHVRDRHKMMIVVSGITDFAKASKEEREQILKQLTPVKEVSTFQKIINRFKRAR